MNFEFPVSRGVSNGILKFLMDTSFTSLVSITSSDQYYADRPPSILLKNSQFYTEKNDASGQWILFDFRSIIIDFNGYSLISNDCSESPSYWRIDVSSNNVTWKNADTKNGQNTCSPGKIYSTTTKKFIRYVKFTQTGLSVSNKNYVRIDRIDFFGNLYSRNCFHSRCVKKYNSLLSFLSFINTILC